MNFTVNMIKEMEKNTKSKTLLVIDDEENMRHMLSSILSKADYSVDTAANGKEGLKMLERREYDFILCDVKMPEMDGMEFLKAAKGKIGDTTVIMMSAYGTIDTAIQAMKLGAYDYISKPFKGDEVKLTLKKAEEREALKKENIRLKEQIRKLDEGNSFGKMVGQSKPMKAVFQMAEKVAQYDTTVLIVGESGTGKELIARGIHYHGERSKLPLVPINCGGIPENLLESELFGYKKGAFTGADRDKKGLFEEANHGTIFLDEIGELPQVLQVKLLRVLQENEIRPIGDSKTKNIDARVITATSKNLEEEVHQGRFREDLFYRLNVLTINLPPLRERMEDLPLLGHHFIQRFNKKFNKHVAGVDPAVISIFQKHQWPGNVRELENLIERAIVLTDETILKPDHFPPEIGALSDKGDLEQLFKGHSLKEAQKVIEEKLIIKALRETGGNRTHAARLLEISHPSLLSKIKAYGITL